MGDSNEAGGNDGIINKVMGQGDDEGAIDKYVLR